MVKYVYFRCVSSGRKAQGPPRSPLTSPGQGRAQAPQGRPSGARPCPATAAVGDRRQRRGERAFPGETPPPGQRWAAGVPRPGAPRCSGGGHFPGRGDGTAAVEEAAAALPLPAGPSPSPPPAPLPRPGHLRSPPPSRAPRQPPRPPPRPGNGGPRPAPASASVPPPAGPGRPQPPMGLAARFPLVPRRLFFHRPCGARGEVGKDEETPLQLFPTAPLLIAIASLHIPMATLIIPRRLSSSFGPSLHPMAPLLIP